MLLRSIRNEDDLMIKRFISAMFVALLLITNVASAEDLPVTSPFGWRVHPISGDWKFHSGVDLGYSYGTGIAALFDGVVVQAGDFDDGYGNQVLLYHQSIDAFTRYGHASELYVSSGESVQAGQIIAAVGSTGYSTGPHLHLEYIVNTDNGYQYADPLSLWQ